MKNLLVTKATIKMKAIIALALLVSIVSAKSVVVVDAENSEEFEMSSNAGDSLLNSLYEKYPQVEVIVKNCTPSKWDILLTIPKILKDFKNLTNDLFDALPPLIKADERVKELEDKINLYSNLLIPLIWGCLKDRWNIIVKALQMLTQLLNEFNDLIASLKNIVAQALGIKNVIQNLVDTFRNLSNDLFEFVNVEVPETIDDVMEDVGKIGILLQEAIDTTTLLIELATDFVSFVQENWYLIESAISIITDFGF